MSDAARRVAEGASDHYLGASFGCVRQPGLGREEYIEEKLSHTEAKTVTLVQGGQNAPIWGCSMTQVELALNGEEPFKALTPDLMVSQTVQPVHPGAAKIYREAG